jgi:hypothetical protein
MEVELFVAQLGHQLCYIVGVGYRVVAVSCRRFVGIAKASKIGRYYGEILRQERKDLIPVKAVFGCAVEQ